MTPQEALTSIITHQEIQHDDMLSVMRQIMQGNVSPVLTAAIMIGLRVKKETINEISGAAQAMRELAAQVPVKDRIHLVDTCGTGGDTQHTFNISTASAFVAAAAGARVAKHGGRSVSSKSGSADVLEILGINLTQTAEQVAKNIDEIGVGFMFAPNYHSAMKYAAPVRQELGVRTLFNILGPLTNPANAKNQIIGVFNSELVSILTYVLHRLGSKHVMVVNGQDGLDEITITGATRVGELKDGKVIEYQVRPEDFSIRSASIETIQVANKDEARSMFISVLENQQGPAKDIVTMNAGAAIYVAGIAPTLKQGVTQAKIAIESGAALNKLHQLSKYSNQSSDDS